MHGRLGAWWAPARARKSYFVVASHQSACRRYVLALRPRETARAVPAGYRQSKILRAPEINAATENTYLLKNMVFAMKLLKAKCRREATTEAERRTP